MESRMTQSLGKGRIFMFSSFGARGAGLTYEVATIQWNPISMSSMLKLEGMSGAALGGRDVRLVGKCLRNWVSTLIDILK